MRHRGREELVYFRLSKKLLLGRSLRARARLSVKQLPRETRFCAKSAGGMYAALTEETVRLVVGERYTERLC
mgnify:CR=1 FL=1